MLMYVVEDHLMPHNHPPNRTGLLWKIPYDAMFVNHVFFHVQINDILMDQFIPHTEVKNEHNN
eukprot:UN02487